VAEKEAKQDELRAKGEVMRLERMRRQREREAAAAAGEGDTKQERWECNCKARHLLDRGGRRGRGRGPAAGRNFSRNIRHQQHCKVPVLYYFSL
jgi:hypothetical protein